MTRLERRLRRRRVRRDVRTARREWSICVGYFKKDLGGWTYRGRENAWESWGDTMHYFRQSIDAPSKPPSMPRGKANRRWLKSVLAHPNPRR